MIDPLSVVITLAVSVGGWVAGRASKRKTEDPVQKTICSCTHGYGSHESAGKCAAQIKRADRWDAYTDPCHWIWVPCPCLTYDGPEPLPRVWTESG